MVEVKKDKLFLLLVLVAVLLVGLQIYGAATGSPIDVSGIILTLIIFGGLALLITIVRGAQEKRFETEDFVLTILGGGFIFGLIYLLRGGNFGLFAFYDKPLAEVQSFVGVNFWWVLAIGAGLVYILRNPSIKKRLGL